MIDEQAALVERIAELERNHAALAKQLDITQRKLKGVTKLWHADRALVGQAAIRERERIVEMIDAHIAFHDAAAEEGEKSGVEMTSIRGAAGGLSLLKRDLMK